MFDDRRIAFMDSGVGGITMLSDAMKLLPNEGYVFFGDNGNMPYGEKSSDEIRNLVWNAFKRLSEINVKCVVIACNTATSAAVEFIRESSDIPVLSVEPAIKPALENHDGNIVMLATNATVNQKRYNKLKEKLDKENRVVDIACHGWAEAIEASIGSSKGCDNLVFETLKPFIGERIDAIVLGCTHYPLIKDRIKAFFDEQAIGDRQFYDGGMATALQLKRVLSDDGILTGRCEKGDVKFMTSGSESDLAKMKRVLKYCQKNL